MNVSTTSTSGWALLANSATIGATSETYQTNTAGASATAMVFDATTGISSLNSKLWCPTGNVTATLSSDTNECNYTPGVEFFSALQTTEANNANVLIQEVPAYYQCEVIRIANGKSAASNGLLTITISFKNTNQQNSTVLSPAIAAKGLRFVVINGSTVVAQTSYWKATAATPGTGTAALTSGINTMVNTNNANLYTLTYSEVTPTQDVNEFTSSPDLSNAANITTGATTTSGGFSYTGEALNDYGVAAQSFYAQYTLELGEIASGAGKNYAIYYWLDGHDLTTSAGAAGISLHFTVGDVPAAQPAQNP